MSGDQAPTFGGVCQLRVQVGCVRRPDGPAFRRYLLDLPARDEDDHPFEDAGVLATLRPVLYAGADAPRHYSLHRQRWHASWGTSRDTVELVLLVVAETTTSDVVTAMDDAVIRAFRDLVELAGRPTSEPLSRDDALVRARQTAATAYEVEPDSLWLGAEEHDPANDCWTIGLRTNEGEQYDVRLGFVDGYAGSARVAHARPIEVSDSLGSE